MKTLVIDRSKWKREGVEAFKEEDTELLNSEGHMCCLGFYMRACKVPVKHILNEGAPSLVYGAIDGLPKQARWLADVPGDDHEEVEDMLIGVNDDKKLSPRTRERKIARLFAAHGNVRVRFVGRTPSDPAKGPAR